MDGCYPHSIPLMSGRSSTALLRGRSSKEQSLIIFFIIGVFKVSEEKLEHFLVLHCHTNYESLDSNLSKTSFGNTWQSFVSLLESYQVISHLSSVGQSNRLVSGRSGVRIPEVAPFICNLLFYCVTVYPECSRRTSLLHFLRETL